MTYKKRTPIYKSVLEFSDEEFLSWIRKRRALRELWRTACAPKKTKKTLKSVSKQLQIAPEILEQAAFELLTKKERE